MLISRDGDAAAVSYGPSYGPAPTDDAISHHRLALNAFASGTFASGTLASSAVASRVAGPARVTIGATVERLRRVRDARGRAQFELVFEEHDEGAPVVRTTTRVDARTLLPRVQVAPLDSGRTVTLSYAAGAVSIVDSTPGRTPTHTSAVVPDGTYSAASLDLVLRALPLTTGFTTTIPLYFPADRLVFPLEVRVSGTERITTRSGRSADCWTVAALFPGQITEHFWIDQRSHALLRILAHESETSLVRYDR